MTREEAINILHNASVYHPDYLDALAMAIKALEQESSYNSDSIVESKLKNPKAKTFDILHFVADNAGLSTFEAIEKAYNMGVSEQEQVLDKIRAEIEQTSETIDGFLMHDGTKRTVLHIFDKYKTESEE